MALTVEEAIARRRSIRKFKPEPIPDEMVTKLLESARLAPSTCNRQPWRFMVVKELAIKQQLRQMANGQRVVEEAPCVFVCCADLAVFLDVNTRRYLDQLRAAGVMDDVGPRIREYSSPYKDASELGRVRYEAGISCAIAIEHIVLTAESMGLGTCWIRDINAGEIQRFFGLPETTIVVALLPTGFPDQSPPPRPRLPLKEIVLPSP